MNRRARMCLSSIAIGALGCAKSTETEGGGGSTPTGGSHPPAKSSASGSSPDGGTACADQGIGCGACCKSVHAAGASTYGLLTNCVLCSECPDDCAQATHGSCPADGPAGSGKCDGTGVCGDSDDDITNDCGGCATATDGPCEQELTKCNLQPDCGEYYTCISACP